MQSNQRQRETHMDTLAIIPARGGSVGIPGKNIKKLAGYPLIAFSIAAAQQLQTTSRVIVSTDCEEIAQCARQFGAEVPFLRPAEFATATATDRGFLVHAMQWLIEHEGTSPEYFVHLRPTTPLRDPQVIDDAVRKIMNTPQATSLRSAHVSQRSPYKSFELNESGYFVGLRPNDPRPEYYNLPRQAFPQSYDPNGYVDVVRASQVLNHESIHGDKMLGFITAFTPEVDTIEDFEYLEFLALRHETPLLRTLEKWSSER